MNMKKKVSIMLTLTMALFINMPVFAAETGNTDFETKAGTEYDAKDDADYVKDEEAWEDSEEEMVLADDNTDNKLKISLTPGKGTADVSSISLDKKTAKPGESVTITVKTENTKRIHFYYEYRTSDKKTEKFQTTSSAMENEKGRCLYNKNTGVYTIKVKIPTSAVSGEWRLHDIQLIDEEEHFSYVLRSKTDISAGDFTIASGYTGRFVPHYTLQANGGKWDGTHYYLEDGTMVTDAFFCDGTYTYYLQKDGTPMKDRLTYHPNGVNIIYFDSDGHEAFDRFVNVKKSIEGNPVDDICYFDTFGYMYRDKLTYGQNGDTNLYYINPYGVMQRGGYFTFPNGDLGYAEENGALMTNQNSYSPTGEPVYFNAIGHAQPR